MKKEITITKEEYELIHLILTKTYSYGWESCLGGHNENDKKECKEYNRDMKMLAKIIKTLF